MNLVPAHFNVGSVPQVNLLPPEVGEKRQRSRQRGAATGLFVLFLLIVAGVYVFAWTLQRSASAAASAEAAKTVELQAQIAEFAEVDVVKAQLANAESARQSAAALEVFWPLLMASLESGMTTEADVELYTVSMPSYGQSPPAPVNPFGREVVATVTFSARVASPVVAATIEDQLNTIHFFERARVTSIRSADQESAEGEVPQGGAAAVTEWIVDGTVDVNYDLLMLRYSQYWFGQEATDDTPAIASLEEYYQTFYERLLAGNGTPPGYPPLPEATPPPFVPGQTAGAPPAAEPVPSPSPEAAP